MASSKEKFLHLLRNDLLKVDLADLDFSFSPIRECRCATRIRCLSVP